MEGLEGEALWKQEREPWRPLRRQVVEVLPGVEPSAVTLDSSLTRLGGNSIDRAEIVTLTMEDLEITVPVMEFARVEDIRSLVVLLQRYL